MASVPFLLKVNKYSFLFASTSDPDQNAVEAFIIRILNLDMGPTIVDRFVNTTLPGLAKLRSDEYQHLHKLLSACWQEWGTDLHVAIASDTENDYRGLMTLTADLYRMVHDILNTDEYVSESDFAFDMAHRKLDLARRLDKLSIMLREARSKLDKETEYANQCSATNGSLKVQVTSLSEDNSRLEGKIAALKKERNEARKDRNETTDENGTLQNTISTLQSEHKKQSQRYDTRISNLHKDVADRDREKLSLQKEVQRLNAANRSLVLENQKRYKSEQDAIDELESYKKKTSKVNLSSIEKQKADLRRLTHELEQEKERHEATINDYNEAYWELEETKTSLLEHQESQQDAQARVTELEETQEELKAELRDVKAELNVYKSHSNDKGRAEHIKKLQATIDKLRADLSRRGGYDPDSPGRKRKSDTGSPTGSEKRRKGKGPKTITLHEDPWHEKDIMTSDGRRRPTETVPESSASTQLPTETKKEEEEEEENKKWTVVKPKWKKFGWR